jgi:hypothetical protein
MCAGQALALKFFKIFFVVALRHSLQHYFFVFQTYVTFTHSSDRHLSPKYNHCRLVACMPTYEYIVLPRTVKHFNPSA